MSRIHWGYKLILVIAIIVLGSLIFYNHTAKIIGLETSNLIIAAASFCVSLLSLGLATIKNTQFKGKVSTWLIREIPKEQAANVDAGYNLVYFEIYNSSNKTINDFRFSFRSINKLVKPLINNKDDYKSFEFSDSIIYSCSAIEFLSSKSSIKFGVQFKESEWSGINNVTIGINGSNIESKSFELHKSCKEMFDGFDSKKPLILKERLSRKEKNEKIERNKKLNNANS